MTRLVRAVLALAPRWFRDRRGPEVLEVHERRAAETSPGWDRLAFGVREVLGAARLVIRTRWTGPERRSRWPPPRPHSRGGGEMMGTVLRSVRHAVQMLARHRGYTTAAVAVLALGIGACTAVLSVVNATFFRPLPFTDADRLVALYETNPEFGWTDATAAPANALDWRERMDGFADIAMYASFADDVTYVQDGEPTLLTVMAVTGNFFDVLGSPPELGRGFRWQETWEGRDDVVVLSHEAWRGAFGADPAIVGRRLDFGSASAEVVGVMPEGFRFPPEGIDLWTPWGWAADARNETSFRRAHFVRPVARLAPGVSPEAADAELQSVVESLQSESSS